jgi:hypothetical protein
MNYCTKTTPNCSKYFLNLKQKTTMKQKYVFSTNKELKTKILSVALRHSSMVGNKFCTFKQ